MLFASSNDHADVVQQGLEECALEPRAGRVAVEFIVVIRAAFSSPDSEGLTVIYPFRF